MTKGTSGTKQKRENAGHHQPRKTETVKNRTKENDCRLK